MTGVPSKLKEYESTPSGGDQDRTKEESVALTGVRAEEGPGMVGNVEGDEGFAPADVTELTIIV